MKLQKLAEVTSTPVSTVKFYLREGLMPPGEKLNATTAAYEQHHVERLRLISALRQVVGLGLVQVRQVIDAVNAAVRTHDTIAMMGAVQTIVLGIPSSEAVTTEAAESRESTESAEPSESAGSARSTGRLTAQEIISAMGWATGSPETVDALDQHMATMSRWGLDPDLAGALVYARAADSVAAHELVDSAPWSSASSDAGPPSPDVIATYTAVGIHAYSQLLLRLLAVAQGSHARRLDPRLSGRSPRE
ncbi:MerR family transcriptional regulator [Citricoccus sp. GCM10030269]|uniref:MerR family transcriptional regulator n=1 Tax=Citricoccus sp. GCM10030269 TaxID=3273388 RepID=UPI003618294B